MKEVPTPPAAPSTSVTFGLRQPPATARRGSCRRRSMAATNSSTLSGSARKSRAPLRIARRMASALPAGPTTISGGRDSGLVLASVASSARLSASKRRTSTSGSGRDVVQRIRMAVADQPGRARDVAGRPRGWRRGSRSASAERLATRTLSLRVMFCGRSVSRPAPRRNSARRGFREARCEEISGAVKDRRNQRHRDRKRVVDDPHAHVPDARLVGARRVAERRAVVVQVLGDDVGVGEVRQARRRSPPASMAPSPTATDRRDARGAARALVQHVEAEQDAAELHDRRRAARASRARRSRTPPSSCPCCRDMVSCSPQEIARIVTAICMLNEARCEPESDAETVGRTGPIIGW